MLCYVMRLSNPELKQMQGVTQYPTWNGFTSLYVRIRYAIYDVFNDYIIKCNGK